MQLLSIAIYHADGRNRTVDFRPGALNVVLGNSRTGKTALQDIVDFTLGRDDVKMPPGIIGRTVSWFGTLWSLTPGGARVFLGRPAVSHGAKETSLAFIRFGGAELGIPDAKDLVVNTDSESLRAQVGAQIGLSDVEIEPREGSIQGSFAVGLGASAFYCFQGQHEVANRTLLFHRQENPGVAQTIRDTLPYFLGAIDGDQAHKRSELRAASRALRAVDSRLSSTLTEESERDGQLRSLLKQAYAVGLTDVESVESRELLLGLLETLRHDVTPPGELQAAEEAQARVKELRDRRTGLRQALGQVLDDRAFVLDSAAGASGYGKALGQQVGRLRSIGLVADAPDGVVAGDHCPVCSQVLPGSDPTPRLLAQRLSSLRQEIETLALAQPAREQALRDLGSTAEDLRGQLLEVESALAAMQSAGAGDRSIDPGRREFVRGRIDATLEDHDPNDAEALDRLRASRETLRLRVEALQNELDAAAAVDRLASLLAAVNRKITHYAQRLELEHSERNVWLDSARLTIMVDSVEGAVPLAAIGSGANWVGYHLAAHLGLHEFFVENERPVPRVLMIDQPSQVFFAASRARAEGSDDEHAVRQMFELLWSFCAELAPNFQIILSEHADVDEPWFSDSIVEDWRGDDGLVPRDWADEATWAELEREARPMAASEEGS
ncbi:DUF3732 domain-containing protein [Agromyces sp. NPDC055520]